MTVHSTNNMMKFLKQSRANGWRVVGTALGNNATPLTGLSSDVPTIVVLGNEGHGLRTSVLREVSCQ
jgi:tRNA G18 (ribose-2'-O)-methylase SpoU